MNWITLSDGTEYHLDGIDALNNAYDIDTIAKALSQINRFTGHTSRPYSVAEHSVLVMHILAKQGFPIAVQLAGLMHDAHEAFVGDVSSPVKAVLGKTWEAFEAMHARNLRKCFGLLPTFARNGDDIKKADLIALATEREWLTAHNSKTSTPWPLLDTADKEITPLPDFAIFTKTSANRASEAEDTFKTIYGYLSTTVNLTEAA